MVLINYILFVCFADRSVAYTNWGITSNELEPKGADECVQICHGGADCGGGDSGTGSWKTTACTSSLNYICEIPCEGIK